MIRPWGLEPYLLLPEDGCRRVVVSERYDHTAFPTGYNYGLLQKTTASIWGATKDLPNFVMTIEFQAEPTPEFAAANVKTIQTFAFPSAGRKFQAVATPENQDVLKFASHLPWFEPRYVMWQIIYPDGKRGNFLFDTWREDLVWNEDYPFFIRECGRAMNEFVENNKSLLDDHNYYIGQ